MGNVGITGVALGAKICEVYQQLVASKLRIFKPLRRLYNPPVTYSSASSSSNRDGDKDIERQKKREREKGGGRERENLVPPFSMRESSLSRLVFATLSFSLSLSLYLSFSPSLPLPPPFPISHAAFLSRARAFFGLWSESQHPLDRSGLQSTSRTRHCRDLQE